MNRIIEVFQIHDDNLHAIFDTEGSWLQTGNRMQLKLWNIDKEGLDDPPRILDYSSSVVCKSNKM